MTPTRKYWISLAIAISNGALAFSNRYTGRRIAVGGLIGGGVFALVTRPRC